LCVIDCFLKIVIALAPTGLAREGVRVVIRGSQQEQNQSRLPAEVVPGRGVRDPVTDPSPQEQEEGAAVSATGPSPPNHRRIGGGQVHPAQLVLFDLAQAGDEATLVGVKVVDLDSSS